MPESAEPKPDFQTAHIGLVHATGIELAPLVSRCDRVHKYVGANGIVFKGGMLRDCRIAFAQVGMGPERAARGTQALLDGHRPQWVISAGFSGALVPELAAGEIVVGNVVRDSSGRELTIDLKMPANPAGGLHVGKLLTIDHVARTADEKERLGCETGALAVDMESAAVAAVCRERKTRFMAVRVISDDMQSEVPPRPCRFWETTGAADWGRRGSPLEASRERQGSVGFAKQCQSGGRAAGPVSRRSDSAIAGVATDLGGLDRGGQATFLSSAASTRCGPPQRALPRAFRSLFPRVFPRASRRCVPGFSQRQTTDMSGGIPTKWRSCRWGRQSRTIFIFPTGPDSFEATEIGSRACEAAHGRGARVVMLPTIPFGTETNLAAFPLAINLNPSTLLIVLRDVVKSLERSGIHKLLLLNSHGGNDFKPALRELMGTTKVHLFLCDWFRAISADAQREIFAEPGDHAGAMETALALAYFGHLVVRDPTTGALMADDGSVRSSRLTAVNRGWVSITRPWHLLTKNSGSGNPHEATAAQGEKLMNVVVERLADFLVELDRSPVDDLFPFQ